MSAAELRAGALVQLQGWASDPATRYLAIATTGLEGVPIEVVLLDAQGQTLLHSLAATDHPIEPGATRVHGVGAAELVGAPSLADVAVKLRAALGPGQVVAFVAPWLGQCFARAGVQVGRTCVSAQRPLSALCGVYSQDHGDFTRVALREVVEMAGQPTAHLAPLGTALGNAQRLALAVRHFGSGSGVTEVEAAQEGEDHCADCGAPFHFCECEAPRWNRAPQRGGA